ncbi:MAG TPA: cytochrome c, partial [Gemmatimonadales bacterium]|nr:cytochrome c [Gemmatimonadales bacterium]
RARGYSDGYIYGMIRYGRGVMPRYGDKVPVPAERWAIVSHVRRLQVGSPVAPGPTAPIPPGPSATGSTSVVPR